MSPRVIILVEWCLATSALLSVLLRLCVRWNQKGGFNASDFTIVGAVICFVYVTVCDTVLYAQYLSIDPLITTQSAFTTLTPEKLRAFLKILYAFSTPYYVSLWLVKIALVHLYYDLAPSSTRYRYPLHAVAASVGLSLLIMLGVNLFWCWPISRNWTTTTLQDEGRKGFCPIFAVAGPYVATIVLHLFTEFLIFIYPLMLVRVLKSDNAKFQRASAMFSVGCLGIVVTIARTAINFSKRYPIIGIASCLVAVEQFVGILICCLPAMRLAFAPADRAVPAIDHLGPNGTLGLDEIVERRLNRETTTKRLDSTSKEIGQNTVVMRRDINSEEGISEQRDSKSPYIYVEEC